MPLERIQENFSWLGINTMSGRRERLFRFVAIIIIEICALTASAAFILKNISIDLEATLYTILQIASQGSLTYMILFAFAVQRKISAMFDHLQDVYTLCKELCTKYEKKGSNSIRFLFEFRCDQGFKSLP